ncbi:hypothetical protein PVAP13_4KG319305 [Panicum virgatum]|uniref:Uncharacterized protein n=1 Tax=Panicum virgatum TaxID=38727 RepID=A0A8T0TSD8_PANVG|nr:hypothetical protein PVAP13_4KG319305 [Panicum virgatum]
MIHGTSVPFACNSFPCSMSALPKRCSFDDNPRQYKYQLHQIPDVPLMKTLSKSSV